MEHVIEFPNLGWELPISPDLVNFTLFGHEFSIKWYGVLIALGFLLAMIYALKRARYFGIDPDRMIDVVLVSAVFAFIGARLYYVLFSEDRAAYFEDPLSILRVWEGGLAIYGGIIFAFVTAIWMCRVRKVNTLAMFDIASLGFLIGQGVGRWGNFFNQEAFGGNTSENFLLGMTGDIIRDNPNNLDYDATGLVHPTFLYESLWCLLGLLVLHLVSKKAYKFKGEIFSLYIMWYGAGRAVIEGLRTDSLMLGTMRVSQLLAILSVIGGLALFFVFRNVSRELPKDLFAEATALEAGGDIPTDEREESPEDGESAGEEALQEAEGGTQEDADAGHMSAADAAEKTDAAEENSEQSTDAEGVTAEEAAAQEQGAPEEPAGQEKMEEAEKPAPDAEQEKKTDAAE